jgi:peptidyl-dipeptidase A
MLLAAAVLGFLPAVMRAEEKPGGSREDEARIFLDMFEAGLKNFYVGMAEEYWKFYTRGDPGRVETFEKIQSEILGDPGTFAKLQEWNGKLADPLLARRVDLLYRTFAIARVTAQEKIYTLQNQLQKTQINFRSTYQNRPATQNQLTNVLRFEKDRALRREAWLARNQVGEEMAPGLTELIRRRNEEARKLGYASFYSMSLELSEIDEERLFAMLDELDRLSAEPYRRWQEKIRKKLKVSRVEPWDLQFDYDDFQGKLKSYFPKGQILPRLKRSFRAVGFDIEKMPILVDDEERPGKSQHAFSFPVNVPDDIRILANADDGIASYRTLFHEMGHSVYSASIRQPTYLLQDSASACFTEGIGQFFPLFLEEEEWLTREAGVPAEMARDYRRRLREEAAYGIRLYLLLLHFERDAYRSPEQDLTRLWWSLSRKYLGLEAQEGIDSWASIIHFTSHPAYYQNYLLADMIAAQLMHHLRSTQGTVRENPATGEFLRTRIFAAGSSVPWERLLAETTGEKLNPRYFIASELGEEALRTAGR